MAGMGSRFAQAGYAKPKPFIDVDGEPMIVRVMRNLYYPGARYILIGRESHLEQEHELVRSIAAEYNAHFIGIEKLTEGTACTVLFAREFINTDEPLLIANSDQLVDCELQNMINPCLEKGHDGSIMTFIDAERNPKWSFAKTDENGFVTEVKEKEAISEFATVGIYFFSKGRDFVNGAIDMIINNDRVNNEFYTCPVYNYTLRNDAKIVLFNIEASAMHGLGTPEDLQLYLNR